LQKQPHKSSSYKALPTQSSFYSIAHLVDSAFALIFHCNSALCTVGYLNNPNKRWLPIGYIGMVRTNLICVCICVAQKHKAHEVFNASLFSSVKGSVIFLTVPRLCFLFSLPLSHSFPFSLAHTFSLSRALCLACILSTYRSPPNLHFL